MKKMLTLETFEQASEIVRKVTNDTSLIYSDYFSSISGNKVYLKPENMQVTGAYKIRGAYYKISTMSKEERSRGLITASAGNHAQGVAYAAKKYGCKATIVMPTTTPLIKVNRTRGYGAEVILKGDVYDESCQFALEMAREQGLTFVHPFDDPTVATGQGTIMMEIFKDLPLVEYVLVPVGGGGLATGVSTLAKLLNPNIKVIAVEPAGAACLKASLKEGKVVTLPAVSTIADGTAVKTPGEKIFPYLKKNIDDVITVSDDELIVAFLDMVENHKMIVENSGLLTVAALKHLAEKNKRVVCVLSGRQHGRHHDVLRRAARTDPERPDLYLLCHASGQAGRAGARCRPDRQRTGQRDPPGSQPVCQHQPQCGGETDHHPRILRHRAQGEDHAGDQGCGYHATLEDANL